MHMLREDIERYLKNKKYVIGLWIVLICSYGFEVIHPAIGTDDPAVSLYFNNGLAPAMGRWVLFLVNKFYHMGDYAPFLTEFLALILLFLDSILWCIVIEKVLGKETIHWGIYFAFSAIFVSCPITFEVFVYYLHNGIAIAYGVVALAVLSALKALEVNKTLKQRFSDIGMGMILLSISLGCYESFLSVFLMTMLILFLLYCIDGKEKCYEKKGILWLGIISAVTIGGLILRSVIIRLVNGIYGLSIPEGYTVNLRSVSEGLETEPGDIIMNLKRFWMMYYVNGIVYEPIALLQIACLIFLVVAVVYGIKKKSGWLPLAAIALYAVPILMCLAEGYPTHYRASQYVPIVGAFGVFMVLWLIRRNYSHKWVRYAVVFLLSVLIYNQSSQMNRWFYSDYLKYQDALEVVKQVSVDLRRDYDMNKPIVFLGAHKVPASIYKDGYVGFDSIQFQLISKISDAVDPHLKEKYYCPQGYAFVETPINSMLQWSITAFNGTAFQLQQIFEMHGYSVYIVTNPDTIAEAKEYLEQNNMPGYPARGYIVDQGDYLIVNLESN